MDETRRHLTEIKTSFDVAYHGAKGADITRIIHADGTRWERPETTR